MKRRRRGGENLQKCLRERKKGGEVDADKEEAMRRREKQRGQRSRCKQTNQQFRGTKAVEVNGFSSVSDVCQQLTSSPVVMWDPPMRRRL